MEIIDKALEFEQRRHTFKTTSERIESSREVKSLIEKSISEFKYKEDVTSVTCIFSNVIYYRGTPVFMY